MMPSIKFILKFPASWICQMPKSHRSAVTAWRHRGITVSEFPPAIWDHKKKQLLKCTCGGFSFQEPKEGRRFLSNSWRWQRGPGSLLFGEGYPGVILTISSVPGAAANKHILAVWGCRPWWNLCCFDTMLGSFPLWAREMHSLGPWLQTIENSWFWGYSEAE